jgi:hypothetical protein
MFAPKILSRWRSKYSGSSVGQLYLRKPELSACSGFWVEDEGCMMLSSVNAMRMVSSKADDVARRACGDCFAVCCMMHVEACRHARELPGLRVWILARDVEW